MNAMNARDKRHEQRKRLRGESLVTWYHEQLRNTLNRSRFNGKIHVIYTMDHGWYVRAVVERNGRAERWWYRSLVERWARETCNTFPAVVMSRSRAAKRPAWNGE